MAKIQSLSEELINKIAAGEVIERPASVVKELIENSLDAGATQVHVEIKDSGKELIKVSDNGEGMSEEDARKSILRHATSKINSQDDLFNISTLGFRGEALASIAAVSQMSLITKTEDTLEGFNIAIEGGEVISTGVIAAERGTTIEIRNLFFNTPARKKFLKTDPVELRHIVETVMRYALINSSVAFTLTHDGHSLLNSPAVTDSRSNIASIYGVGLAKQLLYVEHEDEGIKVSGYIAKPTDARNDKTQQAFFVNQRWVRNDTISKAVYDAYHSTLFVNKHPIVILNIEIDPTTIDVNVHPAKTEVKIEQKDKLHAAVSTAIEKTLQENRLIPIVDESEQVTFAPPTPPKPVPKARYEFEPATQSVLNDLELEQVEPTTEGTSENVELYATPEEDVLIAHPEKVVEETNPFPAMRLLGQIHKTFFVAETLGGLHYIDQHAAHERVLYEQFMLQYMDTEVEVQQLLQGEVLEFSAAETVVIEDNKQELANLGFTLEPFGTNTYMIKTIPLLFGKTQPKEIIYEVLSMLKDNKSKLGETKEEIVTRMACRAAVMAGDTLTVVEMDKILQELAKTERPFTCPHGRPTVLKVSVRELEKMFKRV